MSVKIDTERTPFWMHMLNNSTASSFPSIVDVASNRETVDESGDPSSNLIITTGRGSLMVVQPFGEGDDDNEGKIRVFGESKIAIVGQKLDHWHPVFLLEVNIVLGTMVGLEGSEGPTDVDRYAKTIELSEGSPESFHVISGPTGTGGAFEFDHRGFEVIIISFARETHSGGSAATSLNALVKSY